MKKTIYIISILLVVLLAMNSCSKDNNSGSSSGTIIDHRTTTLSKIPSDAIKKVRTSLKIAYGHSWNIGGQITQGMRELVNFKGTAYNFSHRLTDSILYLNEDLFRGVNGLDNQNDSAWANSTRNYLTTDTLGINVVIWSWGRGVSGATSQKISTYLSLMTTLEKDFPNVKFVYMTGAVDGTSTTDNLYVRNEQIRKYCRDNGKILYDFADIESYDPDGKYFGDKLVDEDCSYDSNKDGVNDANWATAWQNSHTQGVEWFNVNTNETEPLSIDLKAYAAWWLWARLGGWSGS